MTDMLVHPNAVERITFHTSKNMAVRTFLTCVAKFTCWKSNIHSQNARGSGIKL